MMLFYFSSLLLLLIYVSDAKSDFDVDVSSSLSSEIFYISDGWANGNSFDCAWYSSQVSFTGSYMNVKVDDVGCPASCTDNKNYRSGEIATNDVLGYGYFSAWMKIPSNAEGIMSGSVFTYAPSGDEIDIEFTGIDEGLKFDINVWQDGVATGAHTVINLSFDATIDFHEYGFVWTSSSIIWYVDGVEVHQVNTNIPNEDMRLMMNIWPGNMSVSGMDSWLGNLAYSEPVNFQVKRIRYVSGATEYPDGSANDALRSLLLYKHGDLENDHENGMKNVEEELKEEIPYSPTNWDDSDSEEDSEEFKTRQHNPILSKSVVGKYGWRLRNEDVLRSYKLNEERCNRIHEKERNAKEKGDKVASQHLDGSFYKEVFQSGGRTILSVEGLSGTDGPLFAIGGYSMLLLVNFSSGETEKRLDLSDILKLKNAWDIHQMCWVKKMKRLFVIIYPDLYSLDIEGKSGRMECHFMNVPRTLPQGRFRVTYFEEEPQALRVLNDEYLGIVDHGYIHLCRFSDQSDTVGESMKYNWIFKIQLFTNHPNSNHLFIYGGIHTHMGATFTGMYIQNLKEIDEENGGEEIFMKTHDSTLISVRGIKNERDGILLCGFSDSEIRIYDLRTNKCLFLARDVVGLGGSGDVHFMLSPNSLTSISKDRLIVLLASEHFRYGVNIDLSTESPESLPRRYDKNDKDNMIVQRRKNIRDVYFMSWLTDENLVYLTIDDCGSVKAWRNLFRVQWKDEVERIKDVKDLVLEDDLEEWGSFKIIIFGRRICHLSKFFLFE